MADSTTETDTITEAVRARYAGKALEMTGASMSCCASDCCGGDATTDPDVAGIGLNAGESLGCGVPTVLAALQPGERVLDLGSGAGLDVLASAKRVAPGGHAYGVDMTDEMLAVAKRNQERSGVANATFLKGTIEAIPLPDAAVDVVISNCVINLSSDKRSVLREAFRVLRPGGRIAVSDMVAIEELPAAVKSQLDAWAGCVAGTIPIDEYDGHLRAAGFRDISIEIDHEVKLEGVDGAIASAYIRAVRPAV
ncbi:MAG: arsenite methyltransferase [Chloroflexi bacterium]|nr:arsenite methyltransferase [Chloroflexota bacterium]